MTPSIAPAAVAAMFTPSLSSHDHPATCRVCAPHEWIRRSVSRAHESHQYRACAVAPSTESTTLPVMAPTHAAAATAIGHPTASATAAENTPASAVAASPRTVTPPEVPGATTSMVQADRGDVPDREPISVAQVSAAEAASAAAPAARTVALGAMT